MKLCYIKKEFFQKHTGFQKILDVGNIEKQARRSHLCIVVNSGGNNYCIPLRNNLGADVRKYGRIGHSLPSESRPNAGLDYRYTLIVNEKRYIEEQKDKKIPKAQIKRLEKEYDDIKREFTVYLN